MSAGMLSRRQLLKYGLFAGASPLVPNLVMAGQRDGAIELRAQQVQHRFRGSQSTSKLWRYNGLSPGPEIRVNKGERVRVDLINELDVPTSIHWHGIRIANPMDGVSGLTQEPVAPGDRFQYEFVAPDAGTYWYHSHHNSYEQVARGLYGPLIVDDPDNGFARENDMTLMLDDWWLDTDAKLVEGFDDYMTEKQGGRIGNHFSLNGRPLGQKIDVVAGLPYRIRLINAANARVFSLGAVGETLRIIAFDGQAIERPIHLPSDGISLSPGQRIDLVLMPKPDSVVSLNDISGTVTTHQDDPKPTAFIHFNTVGTGRPYPLPQIHRNALKAPSIANAMQAKIVMEGGKVGGLTSAKYNGTQLDSDALVEQGQVWTFNGVAGLPNQPLFTVRRGRSVLLEFDNQTGWQHAMHLHGHHFQVLERNENRSQPVWRDTYLVDPLSKVRIAFLADNPGKWLIHCHMLQHATAGMNTWFEVV